MVTEKVDISLYNGEETVTFYPVSHMYKHNGERLLSVSKISGVVEKEWMAPWVAKLAKEYLMQLYETNTPITGEEIHRAVNMYNEKKAEATYIGTLVHDYVEEYTKGNVDALVPEDENAKNGIMAFHTWRIEHNVEFLLAEKLVFSRANKYVGKFDALIRVDGKTYLADYKTSKDFFALEMGMQTAGYMQAYMEETGEQIDGRIILRFDKETGQFDVHPLEDYEGDVEAFNAALILRKRQQLLSKKK